MSPATIQFPAPPGDDHDDDNAAGWEAAGRQIAPMLGSYSAAVVTSSDPLAAAHAAIGIGLAEAEHRRVAIGDLVGEVEPIQSLVATDDPHGISDSFTFGVSLNKIAMPIDTTGNLFVMPSGTGSVSDAAIFRNARWQRLANGFREVGALLILVAPANAPGLKELIDQMDGVVLVGQTPLDLAPYINVLARIPAPFKPRPRPTASRPLPIWKVASLLLLLVALVGVGIYWRFARADDAVRPRPAFRQPAPKPAPPPDTIAVPAAVNAADSLSASAYAVELAAWNAPDDASQELISNRASLPAATISPVPVGPQRETYYKVVAGAYPARNEADALLASLRHKQIVQPALGTVVRTPYALLVDSATVGRPFDLINKYVHTQQSLRQFLYVLQQQDGSLKLYAGAFERPEDAATLLSILRAAQLSPVLAYRTGRTP